ncbi:MAG: hypothetical protein RLZZ163_1178 [Actinomycetota bacterium]
MDTAQIPAPRLVSLAERDAKTLTLVGQRQIEWDPSTPMRLVVGRSAIASYVVLPMDVLCMVAVPAEVTPEAEGAAVTVSLASFVAGLRDALGDDESIVFDIDSLPSGVAPIGQRLTLAQLPPSEGWQMPIHGVSSDVTPVVKDAVSEFKQRSAGMSERQAAQVAEEIWSRTAWAGLPMRTLHAARRLRLLTDEPLRITASTNGPWKRLSTPRGQLFTYSAGIEARLGLRVVR